MWITIIPRKFALQELLQKVMISYLSADFIIYNVSLKQLSMFSSVFCCCLGQRFETSNVDVTFQRSISLIRK